MKKEFNTNNLMTFQKNIEKKIIIAKTQHQQLYSDFASYLLDEDERKEVAKKLRNYDRVNEVMENPFEDILIWIKSEIMNIAAFRAAIAENKENDVRKNKLLTMIKTEQKLL